MKKLTVKMQLWIKLLQLIDGGLKVGNEQYIGTYTKVSGKDVTTSDYFTVYAVRGIFSGSKAMLKYYRVTADCIQWHIDQIKKYTD